MGTSETNPPLSQDIKLSNQTVSQEELAKYLQDKVLTVPSGPPLLSTLAPAQRDLEGQ